jgi:cell division protein FtsA
LRLKLGQSLTVIAPQTIVGIDVGTTKICTVIAQVTHDGDLSIIGVGRVRSRGLRKGVVVDLDKTIASIRESKNQAEQQAGIDIDSAFVGVTGAHIEAHLSSAVVGISDPQKGITERDTEQALELAQRVETPKGHRLIDVRVREYVVDGQIGIADPVGMNGMRLEVNALLITASIPQLENTYKAVNHAGIDIEDIIIQPIASAEAVLTSDEKEMGTVMIDIGGGTTDLAVYQQGTISHLAIFPVGGDHVDSDLAYGMGMTARQAERIKIQLGGVSNRHMTSTDFFELSKGGDRSERQPMKIIAEIVHPRIEEIMLLIRNNLNQAGLLKQIPSGLVLTGGTSLLPGICELASDIFSLPVRTGYPHDIDGLTEDLRNPMYSTAIGLVKLGSLEYRDKQRTPGASQLTSVLSSATDWSRSFWKSFFK